ncbi:P-II family nitrogen regulator [Olsenella umbonata]|uniref:P-II family nitrogen regulator n=1 Tax=Parafannyhessea umbonata TaxID=604330 RepID=A0A7X9TA89_9ACTN|nr:P-II family nitrogen regulator [Parafannyhessea umbonata]NMF25741.1 P-II family nitrogen regulator [Parafannyhessea umbonata]
MIKVEAIVREERLEDVKEALREIDVRGITVSQVMGCGTQLGYTHVVRGSKVSMNMLPKVKFEIVVSNEDWAQRATNAIVKAARTGEPGDGKVFWYPVVRAVRIRTGERDMEAITPAPSQTEEEL